MNIAGYLIGGLTMNSARVLGLLFALALVLGLALWWLG
jgi:hypothetical protein